MIDLEANLALVHLIGFLVAFAVDERVTQHSSGGCKQQRLQALFAQAALLGHACAAKLFRVLEVFALATVVAYARLLAVAADRRRLSTFERGIFWGRSRFLMLPLVSGKLRITCLWTLALWQLAASW